MTSDLFTKAEIIIYNNIPVLNITGTLKLSKLPKDIIVQERISVSSKTNF